VLARFTINAAKTISENAATKETFELFSNIFGHGSPFHLTLGFEGLPVLGNDLE
jgi:hypothetical protein